MRIALALPVLILAVTAALIIGGSTGESAPMKSGSVEEFVSLSAAGINIDYTPLASPRDAVSKADLIVEGELTDVVDGIALAFPDQRYTERKAGSYSTYVLTVDRVISGDRSKVTSGRVYVAVPKSRAVAIEQLADANARPRALAVLDDITAWTPSRDVRVIPPAAIPPGAPLYAAHADGLWLQGADDAEMLGLHAHPEELAAAWGAPRTVADVSASLQKAAAP